MKYHEEGYEMTTMNRPRTDPQGPGLQSALRVGFLLLVALLFLMNLQSASTQQPDLGPSLNETFGLLPHHIDNGIDRVPLDSLTRYRVDSLRNRYRTGREETHLEIIMLRRQMLQQLNADDRTGLDTTRRMVRDRMSALRESTDQYGRDVASLLHPEQVSILLDMTFIWGEDSEQTGNADVDSETIPDSTAPNNATIRSTSFVPTTAGSVSDRAQPASP